MAVNQTSTNSNVCEKIYKAISHCPLISKVNSSAPNDQKKVAGAAVSTEVPVNFNTPLLRAPSKVEGNTSVEKNGHLEKVSSRNEPVKTRVAPSNGIAPTGVTELEKAKPMVETIPLTSLPSQARAGESQAHAGITASGGGKSLLRRDTFNDRVSDFINSVKAKMRATSNDGVGRSVSIK